VTFIGGKPIVLMLCFDSILLMWLKVGLTKGKKATDFGSSLSTCIYSIRWFESMVHLPITVATLSKHTTQELALVQCTKVDRKECLLARRWWQSAFRYRSVWVGFLYTVCPTLLPSCPLSLYHSLHSEEGGNKVL